MAFFFLVIMLHLHLRKLSNKEAIIIYLLDSRHSQRDIPKLIEV